MEDLQKTIYIHLHVCIRTTFIRIIYEWYRYRFWHTFDHHRGESWKLPLAVHGRRTILRSVIKVTSKTTERHVTFGYTQHCHAYTYELMYCKSLRALCACHVSLPTFRSSKLMFKDKSRWQAVISAHQGQPHSFTSTVT